MPGKASKRLRNIRKAQDKQSAKKALRFFNTRARLRVDMAEIPTVTEHDLLAFQIAHFADDSKPDNWFISPALADDAGHSAPRPDAHAELDETESLGYYPDGVKRTLTDTEIAIFRHTERQEHYRAERLRRDAIKGEEDAGADQKGNTKLEVHVEEKRAKKRLRHNNRNDRSSAKAQHPSKKVAYADYIADEGPEATGFTYRRQARELDELSSAQVELDY